MPQEWTLSCAGLVRTVSLLEFRNFPLICPITVHRSDEVLSPTHTTTSAFRHTINLIHQHAQSYFAWFYTPLRSSLLYSPTHRIHCVTHIFTDLIKTTHESLAESGDYATKPNIFGRL